MEVAMNGLPLLQHRLDGFSDGFRRGQRHGLGEHGWPRRSDRDALDLLGDLPFQVGELIFKGFGFTQGEILHKNFPVPKFRSAASRAGGQV